MRVAVIGAGIVGVMSAYELAVDGHEVSVLERRNSVAAEASFAHAGLISPGWLVPAQAGTLPQRSRWFGARGTAPETTSGGPAGLQLHRLARYSRERLRGIEAALSPSYEQQQGLLVLLRDKQALVTARPALKMLAEYGEPFHLIDAERARVIEPGLGDESALHAAIHLPDDGVANGRLFAQLLKTEAQRLGVRFHFDHEVQRITAGKAPQLQVKAPPDAGPLPAGFDAVVLCAATGAGALLAPLGLRLPLTVTTGCSITAPLQMQDHAFHGGPRTALFDATHQVSISRLGDRVRVAGGADVGPVAERPNPDVLSRLYQVLDDWFPGAAQTVKAQEWQGSRVALPDGMPLLGASGHEGIWLNLAHGGNGWALACGAARCLADRMAGRPGEIEADGFALARLKRS